MGITANSGPYVGFGITQSSSGLVSQYNEERGPSLFDLAQGMLDPRSQYNYKPGSPVGTQIKGFFDQTGLVDYIPFTAGSSSIALSTGNAPVAGTALTLAPVSSLGAFQTTIVAPETGAAVSVVAIDSTAATLNFGTGGTIAVWNPAAGTGRAVMVINSSNTNTEQYIVRGRDMYGFKMTETILASTTSTGTGVGQKAFKYVQSVTPSTATTISATGVSVGFADKFGMPFITNYFGNTTVAISTGGLYSKTLTSFTSVESLVGSTAAVQTSTTPDVRGVTSPTSVFTTNGTSANGAGGTNAQSTGARITILQYVTANMAIGITATSAATMFGPAQFSDF
jgi:hypothetical protein